VAVIGTDYYGSAASDLSVYRAQYGLPPCTTSTGCFTQLNENGQASPLAPAPPIAGSDVLTSQAIDVDMVSAVCPNCKIMLLEADSSDITDMATTVDSAVGLGAQYVVVGWSVYTAGSSSAFLKPYFDHPGVAITAPAGDAGYVSGPDEADYPAALQYVTAVGGTTLTPAPGTARGWSETAWGSASEDEATGSGCSQYNGKPSWQTDTGCAYRTYNDVSAVADPSTGVAVYDTSGASGWEVAGGTTVSAAIVGAVYALAGPPAPDTYPASYPWLHSADLYDVTSGSNELGGGTCAPAYLCTAGSGYDGPTGWGTPDGTGAFALGTISGDLISVINPGGRASGAATSVSVPVQALDSAAGQTLTYAATGLPAGLSVNAATGVITGTPTTDSISDVSVTVSDSAGAQASVSFEWEITSDVVLINPGGQQTEPDSAASVQISASDLESALTPTLAYSASGLPPGLSINSATGLISGTTGPGIASYNVTVAVADTAGASTSVAFTWVVENLITVSVQGLQSYEELLYYGIPVSVQVSATDSAGNLPLTFSATGLPPGLSINSQTGLITGTPAAAGGSFAVITVSDGTGSTGTIGPGGETGWFVAGFSSVVNPGSQTNQVGSVAALRIGLAGLAPGDTVLYQVTGLPPGLVAPAQNESINPASLLISGYPDAVGNYDVTVQVWDDYGASGTVSFSWTVTRRTYHWSLAPPRPPVTR
jgi:hypothetical protein